MVRMTDRRSGLTDAIWQIPCPLRRSKTVTKYERNAKQTNTLIINTNTKKQLNFQKCFQSSPAFVG